MTSFCVSSTSRSRPVAFVHQRSSARLGGRAVGDDEVETIPEPVRSNLIVDTPEDEPTDRDPAHDPQAQPLADRKHPSEQQN